jgi:hypothetical protein
VNDVIARLGRKLRPASKVEYVKLLVDGLRHAQVEQREGPLHVGDVDGLEAPVEDQDSRVDHDAPVLALRAYEP